MLSNNLREKKNEQEFKDWFNYRSGLPESLEVFARGIWMSSREEDTAYDELGEREEELEDSNNELDREVTRLENRVSYLEDEVDDLESDISSLENQIENLKAGD